MYRIVKTGYFKYKAIQIDSIVQDIENIETLMSQGHPVILVHELEDLEELDIEPDEVEIVERAIN